MSEAPMPTPPSGRRHAVLVDAGYLYASVGQLVLGTTSRRDFRVATEPLITALIARAAQAVPGELLRMYWYDAARDRVPTVEQRQIAALPHVKVRLGNLNSAGQQKGVDAQVRQDLEVLARHRAVSDVVLLAGDEDMVPAVEAAQAYGVRVHVWGVEPPYGVNQAERLVWEADTVDQLDADFCRPFLETEPEAELPAAAEATAEVTAQVHEHGDRPLVPTPADVFAGRRAVPSSAPPPGTRLGPDRPAMEEIGARIAARWLLTRGRENVADLLPGPVLPTVIDKELLVEAEEEISRSLRPYEDARRALRDGFWARLHREFGLDPANGAGAAASIQVTAPGPSVQAVPSGPDSAGPARPAGGSAASHPAGHAPPAAAP
ncbi:MAG: NYN domain-containing protein, partial [Mycobacteriales bacterium]